MKKTSPFAKSSPLTSANGSKNLVLIIDTTQDSLISVFLLEIIPSSQIKLISSLRRPAHHQSEKLLPIIQKIFSASSLSSSHLSIKNLRAIGVAVGAGSYTSLKVGAAVANALGFALNIPVFSLPSESCQKTSAVRSALGQIIFSSPPLPKNFTIPLEPPYPAKADWEK